MGGQCFVETLINMNITQVRLSNYAQVSLFVVSCE